MSRITKVNPQITTNLINHLNSGDITWYDVIKAAQNTIAQFNNGMAIPPVNVTNADVSQASETVTDEFGNPIPTENITTPGNFAVEPSAELPAVDEFGNPIPTENITTPGNFAVEPSAELLSSRRIWQSDSNRKYYYSRQLRC